ncbi:hypothetical protein [Halomicrococcus sp. NG-SE-24]|uniref:hypothetical protein n=1 Tax=Halomicrococcus sp. NG-SE-24 TaxID=3436928 RepID=UPI003D95C1E7
MKLGSTILRTVGFEEIEDNTEKTQYWEEISGIEQPQRTGRNLEDMTGVTEGTWDREDESILEDRQIDRSKISYGSSSPSEVLTNDELAQTIALAEATAAASRFNAQLASSDALLNENQEYIADISEDINESKETIENILDSFTTSIIRKYLLERIYYSIIFDTAVKTDTTPSIVKNVLLHHDELTERLVQNIASETETDEETIATIWEKYVEEYFKNQDWATEEPSVLEDNSPSGGGDPPSGNGEAPSSSNGNKKPLLKRLHSRYKFPFEWGSITVALITVTFIMIIILTGIGIMNLTSEMVTLLFGLGTFLTGRAFTIVQEESKGSTA